MEEPTMTQRQQPRQNDDETPDAISIAAGGKPASIQFSLDPKRPYIGVLLQDLNSTGLVDGTLADDIS